MAEIRVWEVSTRRDRREFIQVAFRQYADDPNWVPPLIMAQEELLGFRKHPFHDNNTVTNFLASRDGQVVGRISAIVNRGHNERFDEKRGFFGFFESVDDQAVANALFERAGQCLKAQGMSDVRGPCNPSLNYDLGTLIEGFDSPPTFMMTYNPPYYDKLITGYGFAKVEDLYAYEGNVSMLANIDPKLAFVIGELKRRFNVKVRPFNLNDFQNEVKLFLDIYNRSLVGTWGFVPMSEGEVVAQAAGLKHLLVPEITSIIEVDGKPIGAGLGLLDYNPIIKRINGRLFPFGFLKLIFGKKSLKRVRLMSTNVIPEYQRWGFGLLALEHMLPAILKAGITHGEFSWVLESNHLSRASLERGGTTRTKTYRLYDRSLND
ncbi:MAG: N-acetyltransferase [Pirellulaceae bacterium]|nr:N-acetyltransferase [Pirellulaceae bacterium]